MMARIADDFLAEAEYFQEISEEAGMTRESGFARIVSTLCQLGALLAERLPQPGPRLYEIDGTVIDLAYLVAVGQCRHRSGNWCFHFFLGAPTEDVAWVFTRPDMEEVDTERAKLVAAWRG